MQNDASERRLTHLALGDAGEMRILGLSFGISPEFEDNELAGYNGHDAAAAVVDNDDLELSYA